MIYTNSISRHDNAMRLCDNDANVYPPMPITKLISQYDISFSYRSERDAARGHVVFGVPGVSRVTYASRLVSFLLGKRISDYD